MREDGISNQVTTTREKDISANQVPSEVTTLSPMVLTESMPEASLFSHSE